jgi:hypothetical protein
LAASRNAASGACERSCTRPLPQREGNLVNAGQWTGIASNVLIVPTDVVQHGESGLYVFIIDDQNRAKVRQVKIAHQGHGGRTTAW